jgi:hypothetical protein
MSVANNKIDGNKNTHQMLAILMAMRIRRCNVGRNLMELIRGFMQSH